MKCAPLLPKCDTGSYALTADEADDLVKSGALIVDLRDAYSHGSAHIPGSINVDFSESPQLNWLGVAVSPNIPLVLILPCANSFEEIRIELQRIGYDNLKGWIKDGIHAWIASGRETESLKYLSVKVLRKRLSELNPPVILDVRTSEEFEESKIEGAILITFDRVLQLNACPISSDTETVIVCKSGFRSGIAASLLKAQGCVNISVLAGGMTAWHI